MIISLSKHTPISANSSSFLPLPPLFPFSLDRKRCENKKHLLRCFKGRCLGMTSKWNIRGGEAAHKAVSFSMRHLDSSFLGFTLNAIQTQIEDDTCSNPCGKSMFFHAGKGHYAFLCKKRCELYSQPSNNASVNGSVNGNPLLRYSIVASPSSLTHISHGWKIHRLQVKISSVAHERNLCCVWKTLICRHLDEICRHYTLICRQTWEKWRQIKALHPWPRVLSPYTNSPYTYINIDLHPWLMP